MATNQPEPCILVIFGASGDLTHRKLVPALYELCAGDRLPERTAVLGVSRTAMSDDQFRDKMRESVKKFARGFDEDRWRRFAARLHYYAGDATKTEAYPGLVERVSQLGQATGTAMANGCPNLLFYLSVAPTLYEPIIECVGASGLVTEGRRWCAIDPGSMPWQRIIVEKPFGEDLESAHSLNMALGRTFEEEQIYRIDHYLGKELVQNILVLRFANSIFEPVWNRSHIDHVQVTAAETLGVGSRAASFYDSAGALRDMIQSHLLQVLALVAMEPPSVFDAGGVMREKIKLFNAARILSTDAAARAGVFGRYDADPRNNEPAYVDEPGVDPERRTETYAAVRVEFDNWRWAGVPIYLRSGKKLARKLTEVVVQFKRAPINLFRGAGDAVERFPPNRLVLNIAPSEGLDLVVLGKVPGAGIRIEPATLDLDYKERFGGEPAEAYGPLLLDAMRGDRTLFKHREEVEGGWAIVEPFLKNEQLRRGIQTYRPGSWGPAGADEILARDGRAWHNPE